MTVQKNDTIKTAEDPANARLAATDRIYQARVDNLAESEAQKQDQLDEA